MPTTFATITKAVARQALSKKAADWLNLTTTGAGAGNGTTAVCASLAAYGDGFFESWWLLITSGTDIGQWKLITTYTSASGTFTVAPAFSAQVAISVTAELHRHRPDWYDDALNDARMDAYPAVARPITGFVRGVGGSDWYGAPPSIRDIDRILWDAGGTDQVDDDFTDDDSATSAGSDWTAISGVWGIASNKAYSVTDTDGLLLTQDTDTVDGLWEATVSGTLNSASDYRSPALVFRYIDSSNYLVVRLLNGGVDLRKVVAGSESSLATGTVATADATDYHLQVWAIGTWVRVFVNAVELIAYQYQLLGADLRFTDVDTCQTAGLRLDKGGAPATAARWDNVRVHKAGAMIPVTDWEQSTDRRTFRVGVVGDGPGLGTGDLLLVEGKAPLTAFAANTTYGTLASDSTATAEIEADDPAYQVWLAYALANLLKTASQPIAGMDRDDRAEYRAQIQVEQQNAMRLRNEKPMPRPIQTFRHP